MKRSQDGEQRRDLRAVKVALVAMVAIALGITMGTAVHAATGSWTVRGPWGGMSYRDQTQIQVSSGMLVSTELVTRSPQSGNLIASGYAGAQPRTMNPNGTLCKAGTMTYNANAVSTHRVSTTGHCGKGDTYYSLGAAKYWKVSPANYTNIFYSSPSPYVNY